MQLHREQFYLAKSVFGFKGSEIFCEAMVANNSSASINLTYTPISNSCNSGSVPPITYNYPSLIILGILVVLENSLVCLAFTCNQKLRKRQANILVCSQAAADLIIGLIFVPWKVAEIYIKRDTHAGYIVMYILFVSLFNLFSLALDRYLALIKPLMHHLVMDVNRTKKMLLFIWLAPLLFAIIPISWYKVDCHANRLAMKIYLCIFWSLMLILCIIMIFMYIRIYRTAARTIRRRQKRINNSSSMKENRIKTTKKELKIAHLFGFLLFFFILAYLPILYSNLLFLIGKVERKEYPILLIISLYSLIINSVVNPILCLLLKKDYQLVIKHWICFEWISEKMREENSLRSQVSCKTADDDIETTDSGSDARRKRGAASIRRSRQLDHRWSNASEFKVRFQQDSVALLRSKHTESMDKGNEINGNSSHVPLDWKERRQRIKFEEDYINRENKPLQTDNEKATGKSGTDKAEAREKESQGKFREAKTKSTKIPTKNIYKETEQIRKMKKSEERNAKQEGELPENLKGHEFQDIETEDDSQPILKT